MVGHFKQPSNQYYHICMLYRRALLGPNRRTEMERRHVWASGFSFQGGEKEGKKNQKKTQPSVVHQIRSRPILYVVYIVFQTRTPVVMSQISSFRRVPSKSRSLFPTIPIIPRHVLCI